MCKMCDKADALVEQMCSIGSGNYQELTWEQRKEYRKIWEQILALKMASLGGRTEQTMLTNFLKQPGDC